jgi:hypothetical protein
MRRLLLLTAVLIYLAALGCSMGPKIYVDVEKPAALYLPGVKEVAIADFRGASRSGSQIATLVQSKLMRTQYFSIVERDKLRRILEEQNLGQSGIVDENTAASVGRLLGVDALIFGEVTTYKVEPDERGKEKVEKKVGTGKYEWKEVYNIFKGKKEKVKREVMKTVLVDQHYRIRRGTVAINFRVVGVETGELLAAHSDSKSYNSGKVVEGSYKTLKPEGQILSDLSNNITERFVRMIAPYKARVARTIQSGKGMIQTGVEYAKHGLWPEAMEAWQEAVRNQPDNPAAHYNLGLAYEIQGMLDRAESEYRKAVALMQKDLYMNALSNVRQAKQDQLELERQKNER